MPKASNKQKSKIKSRQISSEAHHIVSSLEQLYKNHSVYDAEPLLRICLNLCHSTIMSDCDPKDFVTSRKGVNSQDLISSIEALKEEAAQAKREDLEMILDATSKLCLVLYYLQLRDEYTPLF